MNALSPTFAPRPYLDIKALVADLGGVASVYARFAALGIQPPTENAIRLWMHRDRVPGDWTGPLLLLAPKNVLDYVVEPAPGTPDPEGEPEGEAEVDPFEGMAVAQ
jgi:hypothetical protein